MDFTKIKFALGRDVCALLEVERYCMYTNGDKNSLSEDSDNKDNTPCSTLDGVGMITQVSQQYKNSIIISVNNPGNKILSDSGKGILQTERSRRMRWTKGGKQN